MNPNHEVYSDDDFHNILKAMDCFQFAPILDQRFLFRYDFCDENLIKLRKDYNLDSITAKKSNNFRKMVALMSWVSNTLIGDGASYPLRPLNAINILNQTNKNGALSNCYTYAVVLNEIFLSMGYYSRMVRCMPMDLHFQDCHCVTVAYVDDYRSWVVFDAANRAYYLNREMIPLDIMSFRKALINKSPIYIPGATRAITSGICNYWTKSMIRFECDIVSCFGAEDMYIRTLAHLQPTTIPVADKAIACSNWSTHHIHTSNPHVFWSLPEIEEDMANEYH